MSMTRLQSDRKEESKYSQTKQPTPVTHPFAVSHTQRGVLVESRKWEHALISS